MSPPPADADEYVEESFEDYEDDLTEEEECSDEEASPATGALANSWPDPFDEGTEEDESEESRKEEPVGVASASSALDPPETQEPVGERQRDDVATGAASTSSAFDPPGAQEPVGERQRDDVTSGAALASSALDPSEAQADQGTLTLSMGSTLSWAELAATEMISPVVGDHGAIEEGLPELAPPARSSPTVSSVAMGVEAEAVLAAAVDPSALPAEASSFRLADEDDTWVNDVQVDTAATSPEPWQPLLSTTLTSIINGALVSRTGSEVGFPFASPGTDSLVVSSSSGIVSSSRGGSGGTERANSQEVGEELKEGRKSGSHPPLPPGDLELARSRGPEPFHQEHLDSFQSEEEQVLAAAVMTEQDELLAATVGRNEEDLAASIETLAAEEARAEAAQAAAESTQARETDRGANDVVDETQVAHVVDEALDDALDAKPQEHHQEPLHDLRFRARALLFQSAQDGSLQVAVQRAMAEGQQTNRELQQDDIAALIPAGPAAAVPEKDTAQAAEEGTVEHDAANGKQQEINLNAADVAKEDSAWVADEGTGEHDATAGKRQEIHLNAAEIAEVDRACAAGGDTTEHDATAGKQQEIHLDAAEIAEKDRAGAADEGTGENAAIDEKQQDIHPNAAEIAKEDKAGMADEDVVEHAATAGNQQEVNDEMAEQQQDAAVKAAEKADLHRGLAAETSQSVEQQHDASTEPAEKAAPQPNMAAAEASRSVEQQNDASTELAEKAAPQPNMAAAEVSLSVEQPDDVSTESAQKAAPQPNMAHQAVEKARFAILRAEVNGELDMILQQVLSDDKEAAVDENQHDAAAQTAEKIEQRRVLPDAAVNMQHHDSSLGPPMQQHDVAAEVVTTVEHMDIRAMARDVLHRAADNGELEKALRSIFGQGPADAAEPQQPRQQQDSAGGASKRENEQPEVAFKHVPEADQQLDPAAEAEKKAEQQKAFQAACKAGAGVGVKDLLADFEQEDTPMGGSSHADANDVSFEDGGFFISAGGGGYNLPLEPQDLLDELDLDDDDDLTEATRRAYLPSGQLPSSSLAANKDDLAETGAKNPSALPVLPTPMDNKEDLAETGAEEPVLPTPVDSKEDVLPLEKTAEEEVSLPQKEDVHEPQAAAAAAAAPSEADPVAEMEAVKEREQMVVRLHGQLLAKEAVMKCMLRAMLNAQSRLAKRAHLAEDKTVVADEAKSTAASEQRDLSDGQEASAENIVTAPGVPGKDFVGDKVSQDEEPRPLQEESPSTAEGVAAPPKKPQGTAAASKAAPRPRSRTLSPKTPQMASVSSLRSISTAASSGSGTAKRMTTSPRPTQQPKGTGDRETVAASSPPSAPATPRRPSAPRVSKPSPRPSAAKAAASSRKSAGSVDSQRERSSSKLQPSSQKRPSSSQAPTEAAAEEAAPVDEQVDNAEELQEQETISAAVSEVPGQEQELAWGQHEIPFQQQPFQAAGNDPFLYEVSDAEFELLLGAGVLSQMGFPNHPDDTLSFSFGNPHPGAGPVGATASFGEQQHMLQMEQFQQQQQHQLYQQQMFEQYQQPSQQQVPVYGDVAPSIQPAMSTPASVPVEKAPKTAPKLQRTGTDVPEESQDGAAKESEGEAKVAKSAHKKSDGAIQGVVPKKATQGVPRRKQAGHPPPGPKKGPGCKLIFFPLEPCHAPPGHAAAKQNLNQAPPAPTHPEDHEDADSHEEAGSQAWDSNGFDEWTAEGEELSHEPPEIDEAALESGQDDAPGGRGSALHSARALRKSRMSDASPRSSSMPPPVSQQLPPRPPAGTVPKGRSSKLSPAPASKKSHCLPEVTKGIGGGLIFGGADTLPGLHMPPVPPPKVPGSRRPSPRHKALHKNK